MRYKIEATVVNMISERPNGYEVGDKIEVSRGSVTGIKCPSALIASIQPSLR